jgi:hypothetical protein
MFGFLEEKKQKENEEGKGEEKIVFLCLLASSL